LDALCRQAHDGRESINPMRDGCGTRPEFSIPQSRYRTPILISALPRVLNICELNRYFAPGVLKLQIWKKWRGFSIFKLIYIRAS
jgi:hypothetical protein